MNKRVPTILTKIDDDCANWWLSFEVETLIKYEKQVNDVSAFTSLEWCWEGN